MAGQPVQERFIESCYPPDELRTATPIRRLAAYVVDTAIAIVTVGFGWFIWFLLVAPRGQSPGKQLLGMYTMRDDGSRAGGWYTWLRELVVKGLLFSGVFVLLGSFTGGLGQLLWVVPAAWCVWDVQRQCLWDKVASTYIAHSPEGFRPLTATDIRANGDEPPARDGIPTGRRPRPSQPAPPPPPSGLLDYPREAAAIREADTGERLRELERLRDKGLITDEEYEQRRAAIVEGL